jgi:hypothetical protein
MTRDQIADQEDWDRRISKPDFAFHPVFHPRALICVIRVPFSRVT